MTLNFFQATELIAVLTAYCIIFCPLFLWAIGGTHALQPFLTFLTPNLGLHKSS